MKRKKQQKTN